MPSELDLLSSLRVNGIMQGIQDPRLLQQPLIWNSRIPDVPAADDEIMARYFETILIADLIADDARAVTYSQGRFQFESTKIPNLKVGIALNQTMINILGRLADKYAGPNDMDLFNNWQARLAANVKYGVELRKETLKVAMLLDSFSYDRLGIKMSGQGWGMYSDLKVTPSTGWANTSATPLTTIKSLVRLGNARYGAPFNRITLSTPAFQAAVGTTEFQNQAKTWGFGMFNGVPSPAIPLQSDSMLMTIFAKLAGANANSPMIIELDDRRYWTQDSTGAITSQPILPINKVILTYTANDGNASAWDFANGVVTEGIVAKFSPGGIIGQFPGGYGPVSYVTPANSNLNPPGIVTWGVARGFPRKHLLQASAVIDTGTLTDSFDTSVPFPQ